MASENREKIPFRFKVSGNIIRKLGGESISNKNIAILELIKNSHDSFSKKVEINFSDINTQNSKIVISDNGDGMDYEDIENKWMQIANTHKTKIKTGNRTIIGEKGIGRLAVESLGRKTTLTSLPNNKTEGYKIEFNWDKYQKENVLLQDVINDGYKFKKKSKERGLKIEIGSLNHNWNDIETQKNLLLDINLINPINKKQSNFKVNTKFSEKLTNIPTIKKTFLDNAVYKLKTRLQGGASN